MWPYSHIIMFFGMFIIHIAIMPWIMLSRAGDFTLSLNQAYMGAAMAAMMVMLEGLMHPMPLVGWLLALTVLAIAIYAVRKQLLIRDGQFLRDMIPHHSMALLTSSIAKEKALSPEVRSLAATIEQTQADEIETMRRYLDAIPPAQ